MNVSLWGHKRWGANTAAFRLLVQHFGFIGIDGLLPADMPKDASWIVALALRKGWLKRQGALLLRITENGHRVIRARQALARAEEREGRDEHNC